jgi:ABC-type multidrug transport system permease subunit
LAKQKGYALFHPIAFVFAQILSDLPIVFVQVTLFSLILYFMSGLLLQAGAFFTYFAILYSMTMCVTAL